MMEIATEIETTEANLARVRRLARTFAQGVREHLGGRCRRVRLFGSAARGDWTDDSDVDVLVLLDEVRVEDRRWLSRCAYDIGLAESGILLQPIPMAERQFDELRSRERRFAQDVEREGIEL